MPIKRSQASQHVSELCEQHSLDPSPLVLAQAKEYEKRANAPIPATILLAFMILDDKNITTVAKRAPIQETETPAMERERLATEKAEREKAAAEKAVEEPKKVVVMKVPALPVKKPQTAEVE